MHMSTATATEFSSDESRSPEAELIRIMMLAREADRREGILFRQGRGWFFLPSSGHEPMAVLAEFLHESDYKYLYYRDRALLLAMGWTVYELALEYFAREDSSSGGRQMPSFASDRSRNIVTMAPPTGLQYLPAAGSAWACKLRGEGQIALCSTGEAATREGEFYEALCFATEQSLPIVFVVEDNGWGISTPTGGSNPLSLGVLNTDLCVVVNGRDIDEFRQTAGKAIALARAGGGPMVLWVHMDRLGSHSAADDHRGYRSRSELESIGRRDFMRAFATHDESARVIEEFVTLEYERAEAAAPPGSETIGEHVFATGAQPACRHHLPPRPAWTMAAAMNSCLRELLREDSRVLLFGQDIEDPKGGVFGITKGLSPDFPGRVVNAPLAEATIAGTASGLALAGYLPIFELQFIDFAGTALNQIVNQISTVRWRSKGAWANPLILLAPCGGYVAGAGPWHSQSNEGWFAHAPGLRVAVPSTPGDAAALLRAAALGEDPVLFLIPKSLLRQPVPAPDEGPIAFGKAAVRRRGSDITLVAWGNSVSITLDAADALAPSGISAEVLDLRTLVPCDWPAIRESLEITGRLVVVQEDNRTCSFGQSILAEVTSSPEMWNMLFTGPELVSRPDVHVGFHPTMQAAALPSVRDIVEAATRVARA